MLTFHYLRFLLLLQEGHLLFLIWFSFLVHNTLKNGWTTPTAIAPTIIANTDCVVMPAVIPNKLAVTTVSLLIIVHLNPFITH